VVDPVQRVLAADLADGDDDVDDVGPDVVSLLLRPQVMSMYPYLATVVVLVLATRRVLDEQVGAPSALLDNYSRETE